jgi:hypothetical protein
LSLASGEVAHVSFLISRQAHTLKEQGNLRGSQRLPALMRPVRDVASHGAGKKKCSLHDHADPSPQLRRRQLTVVSAMEPDDATCRFVQPIQQPQEGCFSRSAVAYDGENFANLHFDADFVHEGFFANHPRQMLARESCPVRRRGVDLISIFHAGESPGRVAPRVRLRISEEMLLGLARLTGQAICVPFPSGGERHGDISFIFWV